MKSQVAHSPVRRKISHNIFDNNKNKILKNLVPDFVPHGTSRGIIKLLEDKVDFDKQVNLVSKEERKEIVRTLKALPLTITGLMGFDRAVVADGGVALDEIDMKTMRSKVIPNLFVTGDLLNIKRPSGGYSLQLCWTTGYVAGNSVSE
jgi:predicted flavoprotein YhiN